MTSGSKLNSSESIALKAISGVGLAIFTALMVVHWNNVLSKVEVAEETAPPVTPSTTTNAAAAPPVASTSGVAPSATSTSAIATDSSTATPSTPVSSGTAPITTTPTTPTSESTAAAPSSPTVTTTAPITTTSATTTTSTPVETTPAEPSSLAAVESTPPATSATTSNFDAAQLEALEVQLYDTLDQRWTSYPSFGQDLVYKVTVDADGNIIDYQPLHDAAVDYLNETPLDSITPNSAATGADFVVVMTPSGVLEVDSWIGQ